MKNRLTSEQMKSIKKILVIQTAFIGDVILITPLIKGIRELFNSAIIDVMVIPQTSGVLANNPNINKVILFDKKSNKFKEIIKTIHKLRKERYDAVISPHSSITTAFIMYLARIPIRIGFARWTAQYLLTHKLPHLKKTSKIRKNLHLLSPFSDTKFSIQTELHFTEQMKTKAERLLEELHTQSKKLIAVAPGSIWFTKRWPLNYYENLIENLSRHGYGIVFIGSEAERNDCEQIIPQKNFINLAGQLSLLESAAVVSKCDLMICNDSGAMHIANAVKTDVIVFFGPTVKGIGYAPIGETDIVFEVDLDCRPCGSHGSSKCPLDHFNCMKMLEPELVFKKIKEKLK